MLSYCQMQSDDINKRKIITSVEIVDIPPPTDKEAPFKADDEPAGTTKLSKEELQLLFQGRNLAFLATLSKDGSPHVTIVWAEIREVLRRSYVWNNAAQQLASLRSFVNSKHNVFSFVRRWTWM